MSLGLVLETYFHCKTDSWPQLTDLVFLHSATPCNVARLHSLTRKKFIQRSEEWEDRMGFYLTTLVSYFVPPGRPAIVFTCRAESHQGVSRVYRMHEGGRRREQ